MNLTYRRDTGTLFYKSVVMFLRTLLQKNSDILGRSLDTFIDLEIMGCPHKRSYTPGGSVYNQRARSRHSVVLKRWISIFNKRSSNNTP
jgi:hypothetical protein